MRRAVWLGLVVGLALSGCGETRAAGKGKTEMKPAAPIKGPLICLWQHEQQVDIAPLVKALKCNLVWTDDAPYHGQAWEETHMYRALQVPGVRYVIPKIERLAVENRIQAYNLPEWVIVHLYRDIAARKPGTLSRVGLGTFVDPRLEGGRMNEVTHEDIVRVVEFDPARERLQLTMVEGATAAEAAAP